MFDNIGNKIKALTKTIFWIEAIASMLAGFGYADMTDGFSVFLALIGVLLAWISTFFFYGFGEIICKLTEIEKHTRYSYRNDD